MKIDTEKLKVWAKNAAYILAVLGAAALFWLIALEFMWTCYYAGIPM